MDAVLDYMQNITFLGLVIWREARGEPKAGKIAVAYTVMNRVQRPKWWGDSVLAVIGKKWQYSSMTDPNDRQLVKWPTPDDMQWRECMEVARDVYEGNVYNPAPGADSYFADTIPPPKWADTKKFVVKIGHHSFYDLDSDYEKEIST